MKYLGFVSIAMLLAVGACSKTDQGAPKEAAPAASSAMEQPAQAAPGMMTDAEKDKKPADAPAAAP